VIWSFQRDDEGKMVGASSTEHSTRSEQLRIDAVRDREFPGCPAAGVDPSKETAIVVGEEQAAIR
jgi:hypothetical protein